MLLESGDETTATEDEILFLGSAAVEFHAVNGTAVIESELIAILSRTIYDVPISRPVTRSGDLTLYCAINVGKHSLDVETGIFEFGDFREIGDGERELHFAILQCCDVECRTHRETLCVNGLGLHHSVVDLIHDHLFGVGYKYVFAVIILNDGTRRVSLAESEDAVFALIPVVRDIRADCPEIPVDDKGIDLGQGRLLQFEGKFEFLGFLAEFDGYY